MNLHEIIPASGNMSSQMHEFKLPVSALEAKRLICAETAQQCSHAFENDLLSVVLTGSLAREEATFVSRGTTRHLVGDADYFLVFREAASLPSSSAADQLTRDIEARLEEKGVVAKVGLHAVRPSYLKILPAHIASFELRTCGQIIWGDPNVLASIPHFSAADITREDAWRILCNRAIEHLADARKLSCKSEQLSPALHYATVKLYLDMATSYLIFTGQYAPTYQERASNLQLMASQSGIASTSPFSLTKFARRVAECTEWKLSGEDADRDLSIDFWTEAIAYFRRLWRWEMIQMAPGSDALTVSSLCDRLAQLQPVPDRLRGWVSVVKRRGWAKSWRNWPQWSRLGRRGTPRYLVYRAATELVYRLPCLVRHSGNPPRLNVNWDELRQFIPEPLPSQKEGASIVPWQLLADEIVWNYWQFLANTRA